jgi:hypothetical protein
MAVRLVVHSGTRNRFTNPPNPICRTRSLHVANVRTDCEFATVRNGMVYSDETAIAVNPSRPNQLAAVVDDNQILLTGRNSEVDYAYPRVRMSDDGGQTWVTRPIDFGNRNANDSEIAIDRTGNIYVTGIVRPGDANADIFAAHSTNGGRTWSAPVRVAAGLGTDDGIANDQDALAAWGNGNAIVAWAQYHYQGGYRGSPIMASVTHDGGVTWTPPVAVSGSSDLCLGIGGGHACDQAQGAEPVVTADGHVLVSFVVTDKSGIAANIDRDTLMVAEVDPASGALSAGPFRVAPLYDGSTDYPVNVLGLPTLHDSQFIVSSLGNIASDPTNAAHLAEVWSDMRNSPLPAALDPYAAPTNSDVVVSQSFDRGRTWGSPVPLALPGDQFQPSPAFDRSGRLRIGFFDRSYDPANRMYGYSLAAESTPGSSSFTYREVTTALSDPTRDDHMQAEKTYNPSFPHPTRTIGDHGALVATTTGVAALWTDLRDKVCFGGRCGAGQGAYFAALP